MFEKYKRERALKAQRERTVQALRKLDCHNRRVYSTCHTCSECFHAIFTQHEERSLAGEVFVRNDPSFAYACLRCQTVWPSYCSVIEQQLPGVHIDDWDPSMWRKEKK